MWFFSPSRILADKFSFSVWWCCFLYDFLHIFLVCEVPTPSSEQIYPVAIIEWSIPHYFEIKVFVVKYAMAFSFCSAKSPLCALLQCCLNFLLFILYVNVFGSKLTYIILSSTEKNYFEIFQGDYFTIFNFLKNNYQFFKLVFNNLLKLYFSRIQSVFVLLLLNCKVKLEKKNFRTLSAT